MANTPLGFPFGFYVADNSPIDGKYGIIAGGAWRPYINSTEALTSLPTGIRYIGLTVNIANVEYWWKTGTADGDLVVKSSGASVSLGTQGQVPFINPAGNDFVYSNNFTWDDTNKRLTIGSGNVNAQGIHNYVLAPNCQIIGSWNFATGEQQIIRFGSPDAYGGINNNSFLGGYKNLMEKTGFGYGIYNTVFLGGEGNLISGPVISGAAIYGIRNKITGVSSGSLAGGIWTEVSGFNAWAHGDQTTNSASDFNFPAPIQNVLAAGRHAFNYSANSPGQTVGHGALSDYGAILAGTDHNIPITSPRTIVLGGNAIKVPDNRPDEVFVPALAIWNAPEVDAGTLNALVYDPADRKVKQRSISSSGGGGSITASNGLTKTGNDIALGGNVQAAILNVNNNFGIMQVTPNSVVSIGIDANGGIFYQGVGEQPGMITGFQIESNALNAFGIVNYINDYSGSFTDRSLVDKAYVDSAVNSGGAQVIIQNTYFVSPSGNDGTGVKGDFSKPFTPQGAAALVVAGETIAFLPGNYLINTNIAKNGVEYSTFGGKVTITVDQSNAIVFDYVSLAVSGENITISGDFDFIIKNGGIVFNFQAGYTLRSYVIKWSNVFQYAGVFMKMPGSFSTGLFEGNINIDSIAQNAAIQCNMSLATSGSGTMNLNINNNSLTSYAISPWFDGFSFNISYIGSNFGLFGQPLNPSSGNNIYKLNVTQASSCVTFFTSGEYVVSVSGGQISLFNGTKVNLHGRLNNCTLNAGPATTSKIIAEASAVTILNDQVTVLKLDGTWVDCSFTRTSTSLCIMEGQFYNLWFLSSSGVLKITGYVSLKDNVPLIVNANEYLDISGKLVGNGAEVILLSQRAPIIISGYIKQLGLSSPAIKAYGGGYNHLVTLNNGVIEAGVSSTTSIEVNNPDGLDLKIYGKAFSNKPMGGTGAINYLVGSVTDYIIDDDINIVNA